MTKLRLEVWSDIVCPWCYIGKRRLESALAQFPHRAAVEIAWRAFELDPSAPRQRDPAVSPAARLAQKYGTSVAVAETRIARVVSLGAAEGLDFRYDRMRGGNTFDAHRVVQLAGARGLGLQSAVKERLMRAYFTEGEPIGDRETLARLGVEAGLEPDDVRAALAQGADSWAERVRADERAAAELGVGGVPFFVFAGRYAVSGAQPADLFLRALTETWAELGAGAPGPAEADVACGPDDCDVA
jgi:predicted DsbA family dithiol-disulfide isomerase